MKDLTPCQAIRLYCLTCESSKKAVKSCLNTTCSLWPYRLGHNPNRQGVRKTTTQGRNDDSGRFLPSQHGGKRILQTVTDGKKRIRVIVEDVR